MAYSELIKNFDRIRDYMREFYLYGFKSRNEYTQKSARSYDDERRRVESWLGSCMSFRQTPEGKNVFLSIDSRVSRHNPLYAAWKTKSFTDGDITLHFILFRLYFFRLSTFRTAGENAHTVRPRRSSCLRAFFPIFFRGTKRSMRSLPFLSVRLTRGSWRSACR